MPPRSFVVFQDEQPSTVAVSVARSPSPTPLPLAPITPNVLTITLPTVGEKENLHPVTGGPPLVTPGSAMKKRKNSLNGGGNVLAAKPIEPATRSKSKKLRDAPEGDVKGPDVKKRRSSSLARRKSGSDASESESDTGEKRKRKVAKKVVTRRATTLAKVEEEAEAPSVTQAEIDSRCYDLTVKPLADVSCAFEDGAVPKSDDEFNEPTVESNTPDEKQLRQSTSRVRDLSPTSYPTLISDFTGGVL